jgi:aromatic-L-amino-acid decarboxylase
MHRMPTDGWPLEPDAATFDALTRECVAFVREHVLSLPDQPSHHLEGADALCASFREPPPENGRALGDLLERLKPAIQTSFTTAGPGYLAFIPGGGVYAAALADYIALSVNRYMGVAKAAPALSEIETTVIRWLADLMGYPRTARGLLTSGGSLSTLIACITARIAQLGDDFAHGTVYYSEETHLCVPKAARLAGVPARNLRPLPVDDQFRLVPSVLQRAIHDDRARGLAPFLVVANVGTVNTGAIDPLDDIVDIARAEHMWVHADAAYGGFFRLVHGGERLMPGIERCDSIVLDPHKGLFLPYGTGCLLVRDSDALLRAHRGEAAYLHDVAAEGERVNFSDLSPELSRDFRGIRIWLPLQLYGLRAFREQLQEKLALTRSAYERLRANPHFELLGEPALTVIAFRLRAPEGDADGNALGEELLRRVNERRRVFLSSTTIGGHYVLRICVLSFRTHSDRIDDALTALEEEAGALVGGAPCAAKRVKGAPT